MNRFRLFSFGDLVFDKITWPGIAGSAYRLDRRDLFGCWERPMMSRNMDHRGTSVSDPDNCLTLAEISQQGDISGPVRCTEFTRELGRIVVMKAEVGLRTNPKHRMLEGGIELIPE